MSNPKIVHLEMRTWTGLSIGAIHYYGTLECGDKEVDVKFKLDRSSAAMENKLDRDFGRITLYKHKVGEESDKLNYVAEHLTRYFDALAQKEATNQLARSDVLLPDGSVVLTNVPATLLLTLENKLTKLREMYDNIPTLQPGVEWVEDTQASMAGVFKAVQDEMGLKTEKDFNFRILVQPTKEHPAQIEKWSADKPVGEYKRARKSGMLTPKRKSELLGRLDTLIGVIKQARMRANTQEVMPFFVGKVIFDFLHK